MLFYQFAQVSVTFRWKVKAWFFLVSVHITPQLILSQSNKLVTRSSVPLVAALNLLRWPGRCGTVTSGLLWNQVEGQLTEDGWFWRNDSNERPAAWTVTHGVLMTSRSHCPLMSSSDGCSVMYRPSNSSFLAISFSLLNTTRGTWRSNINISH